MERVAVFMGTSLRASVEAGSAAEGFAALEVAFGEVERAEALLSSWRQDSELARLNRAQPGSALRVSERLFSVLLEVKGWVERTEGAFDPAVGPLIDSWDLRGAGRRPSAAELAQALAATGFEGFEVSGADRRVVRRWAGSWISAGAFGKGYALRAARDALRRSGVRAALLDFGGQVLGLGCPEGAPGWPVVVAHPSNREAGTVPLSVRDMSVATSGASERFVEVNGERMGHVLDPRSGRPVPAWGSVTVMAKDPLVADVLATALFVLGPEQGFDWVEAWEDIGVLFLKIDGDALVITANAAMRRWLMSEEVGA